MRRLLFPTVASVSFLLFLTTVALWLRSAWRADEICCLETGRGYYVEAARGSVMYFTARVYIYPRSKAEWTYVAHGDAVARAQAMDDIEQRTAARHGNGLRLLGFSFRGGGWIADKDETVLMLPLW